MGGGGLGSAFERTRSCFGAQIVRSALGEVPTRSE